MKTRLGVLPAHVLLLERAGGLVLVDSGIGLADCAAPARMGPVRHLIRPTFDPRWTAVRQLEELGFSADDVTDVVLTHLDLDHAGGIADVPGATVHVTADEHAAATVPHLDEKLRYRSVQWGHDPRWSLTYRGGVTWKGFQGCTELFDGDVLLVPMPGHTRGHAAVAVRSADGWLVHAGDAFFHRGAVRRKTVPLGFRAFEAVVAVDRVLVASNHERLATLADEPDVTVFCAHDPVQLRALQGRPRS